jgi:hypothetical protein
MKSKLFCVMMSSLVGIQGWCDEEQIVLCNDVISYRDSKLVG